MTDVVVNESRFVVDMSDEIKDHALRGGMVLPDGQVVGDQIDRSDAFQIYDTRDGSFILLVTGRELASRWIAEGFLPERAFGRFTGEDGKELWVLYSPTSLILQRVTLIITPRIERVCDWNIRLSSFCSSLAMRFCLVSCIVCRFVFAPRARFVRMNVQTY